MNMNNINPIEEIIGQLEYISYQLDALASKPEYYHHLISGSLEFLGYQFKRNATELKEAYRVYQWENLPYEMTDV